MGARIPATYLKRQTEVQAAKVAYHKTKNFRQMIHTIKTKNAPQLISWKYFDTDKYRLGDIVDRLTADAMLTKAELIVKQTPSGVLFRWRTERQAREAQYG